MLRFIREAKIAAAIWQPFNTASDLVLRTASPNSSHRQTTRAGSGSSDTASQEGSELRQRPALDLSKSRPPPIAPGSSIGALSHQTALVVKPGDLPDSVSGSHERAADGGHEHQNGIAGHFSAEIVRPRRTCWR